MKGAARQGPPMTARTNPGLKRHLHPSIMKAPSLWQQTGVGSSLERELAMSVSKPGAETYTVMEVAKMLGISKSTIYELFVFWSALIRVCSCPE